MSVGEPGNTPASQRRAQRRQATYAEMIALARTALREGRPVSLRAIAAEMGMTAPALYRYVDSHAALQDALVQSILAELVDRLGRSDAAWPEDRPGHRVVCSLYALREWALERPEEFRLVFGQPNTPNDASALTGRLTPVAVRFVHHFMSSLVRLHQRGDYVAAAEQDVPTAMLSVVSVLGDRCADEGLALEATPGLWWRAISDWVVLCGVIRIEVDEMPADMLAADDALFRQTVALCARRAGETADGVTEMLLEGAGAC